MPKIEDGVDACVLTDRSVTALRSALPHSLRTGYLCCAGRSPFETISTSHRSLATVSRSILPLIAAAAATTAFRGRGGVEGTGFSDAVHPALPLHATTPYRAMAVKLAVNLNYVALENNGMVKVAERENSATLEHFIEATRAKLKVASAKQGRLVNSKDRPARVKGWRPYDVVVLEVAQLKRHLDVHETVLRAKLHEESISSQVQQALDSYVPGASSAVHSVLLKQASIHSTAAKQAEHQNHTVALIEAEKVKAIDEQMEKDRATSEVGSWLKQMNLFRYAKAMEGEGCDALLFLIEADEAAVKEMATEIMPKMHLLAFMRGWKKLVAANAGTTTGVDATAADATNPELATEPQPTELQPTEAEAEAEAELEAEPTESESEPEAEPEPTPEPAAEPEPTLEPAESVDRSVSDPTSPPGSPQYMMSEHSADVLRGQGLTMLGPKKAGGEEKEDNVDNGDDDEQEDTGDDLLQQQQQQQPAFTPSAPTTTPPP